MSHRVSAATFAVTNTNPSGTGSLAQAIADANNQAGADTILVDPGVSGTITLSGGPLRITDDLRIAGPGARFLSVSGGDTTRVFEIIGNSVRVTIDSLTISHGFSGDVGGGIYNEGTLRLDECNVTDNSVQTPGSSAAKGGGIYSTGSLTVYWSTVQKNSAVGYEVPGFNPAALGGGIYATGSLNIEGSTISNNTALTVGNNAAGLAGGGGLAVDGVSTAQLTDTTIALNTAHGTSVSSQPGLAYGGGVYALTGSVTALNTLIGTNIIYVTGSGNNTMTLGEDVNGGIISTGYLLIGHSSGATISGNLIGLQKDIDPLLGSLQNNGGPTDTCALQAGSPAIDKGKRTGRYIDQRGGGRPSNNPAITPAAGGDDSDIGAFEVEYANLAPTIGVPGALTTNKNASLTLGGANRIDVQDPDAGDQFIRLTLSATGGKLTLATTTDLIFNTGDGNADQSLTFMGQVGKVNAALDRLVFIPDTNFTGAASLAVTANDMGNHGTGGPKQSSAVVSITIIETDRAPVANAVSVVTSANTAAQINLTAIDPDGDPLTFSVVAPPAHGSLSAIAQTGTSAATIIYTPNNNYWGSDSFSYRASDGILNSVAVVASITVQPPANLPLIALEEGTDLAAAIDSVTFMRSPFRVLKVDQSATAQTGNSYSDDGHTRVTIFATNLELANGETLNVLSVNATDAQGGVHNLPVEALSKLTEVPWLYSVTVRLPDSLQNRTENLPFTITFHNLTSLPALLDIKQ